MNHDWLLISADPLSIADALAFVADARAGGIDLFLGVTRAETADGRELLALDYEAFAEMAIEQFRALAKSARDRFDVVKIAMLHRIGRVAVGEPSVVIAVSAPHRGAAFDACRFLIDELKAVATIWKKEIWTDGTESWVDPVSKNV